ncbi:MAG: ABC transporter permease [Bacillota bacterium]
MNAVFRYTLTGFRKKRLQTTLIFFTVAVSALLFSTAIGLMNNIQKPFEALFTSLNASHTLLIYDTTLYAEKDINEWWRKQPQVEGVSLTKVMYLKGDPYVNGQKQNLQLFVAETNDFDRTQDKLKIIEGTTVEKPGKGEIWLTTAYAYGNNLKIGDIIKLPAKDGLKVFKLTAIVVDAHYSSGSTNPTRAWVGSGEIKRNFGASATEMLGIKFREYSPKLEADMFRSFEKYLENAFVGSKIEYSGMKFGYMFFYQLLGAIMLSISCIIISVGLLVIVFTISNAILSDYAKIGILKSQGFSSWNIISMNILKYAFISIISIPLGAIGSGIMLNLLLGQLNKKIGNIAEASSSLLPGLITFAVLTLIIAAVVLISSYKVVAIKPVAALRLGVPVKSSKFRKSINQSIGAKLPVNLLIGLREIVSDKRHFVFIAAAVAVTVLVLVSTANIQDSMFHVGDNMSFWGFEDSDLIVKNSNNVPGFSDEDLLSKLNTVKEIENVVIAQYIIDSSVYFKDEDIYRNIVGIAYKGDMTSIGLINLEGKNPANDMEVTIGKVLSDKLNKSIGDYMEVYIEGEKKSFLITGVFQTINNMGMLMRFDYSVIKEKDYAIQKFYHVIIEDGVTANEVSNNLKNIFGERAEIRKPSDNLGMITGNLKTSAYAVFMIGVLVAIICFISIFNTTMLSILKLRKKYGILKSVGISSDQIRTAILLKVGLAGIFGLLAGISFSLIAAPWLMNIMFSSVGILKFPFTVNVPITLLSMAVCLAVALSGAWFASKGIKNIKPRELIIE